jgi:hypothetical protein
MECVTLGATTTLMKDSRYCVVTALSLSLHLLKRTVKTLNKTLHDARMRAYTIGQECDEAVKQIGYKQYT